MWFLNQFNPLISNPTFLLHLTVKGFMTESGPVLTSYFGGRDLPGSSTEHSCHLLSAFLTWYNIPHPKALRQMGLQGMHSFIHSQPLCSTLSKYLPRGTREQCSSLDRSLSFNKLGEKTMLIEREPMPDGRPECSRATQCTGYNKL